MRIARLATAEGPRYAVDDDGAWAEIDDPFVRGEIARTGVVHPGEGARLLAPTEPRVVVGSFRNTASAGHGGLPAAAFFKSPYTVVGPGEAIVVDPALGAVKGEVELALVVGTRCRFLSSTEEAAAATFGYTVANDVTAVDQLPVDDVKLRAKNGEGFTPLGPWIETEFPNPADAVLVAAVDGTEVLRSSTNDLVRGALELLVWASEFVELRPGDVLLTGSPWTAFDISPGQECTATVEGIGSITNPVRAHAGR